jgi:hypothetical protein
MQITPVSLLRDESLCCRGSSHELRGTSNTTSLQFWIAGDSEGAEFQIFAAYSDTSPDWYHLRTLPPCPDSSPRLYAADVPPCPKLQIRVVSPRVHAFTLRINEVKL